MYQACVFYNGCMVLKHFTLVISNIKYFTINANLSKPGMAEAGKY